MDPVFVFCKKHLEEGHSVCLVGIMEVQGSSPRHKGSFLAVEESGMMCGTIGGGKLEYDALQTARNCIEKKENVISVVEMTDMSEMICGGKTTLLFTYLDGRNTGECLNLFHQIEDANLRKEAYYLSFYEKGIPLFLSCREYENRLLLENEQTGYDCYFKSSERVHLFGSGHVISALVTLLSALEFECLVYDDRQELLQALSDKDCRCKLISYDDIPTAEIAVSDYVVIATRGHERDLDVIRKVLQTKVHYVGVMGSRRKGSVMRQVLSSEGFGEQDIDRIISPIGLPIGSETPEEIAVSIAAQLIEDRRKGSI